MQPSSAGAVTHAQYGTVQCSAVQCCIPAHSAVVQQARLSKWRVERVPAAPRACARSGRMGGRQASAACQARGGDPARRAVELKTRSAIQLRVVLPPLPSRRPDNLPYRWYPYCSAALRISAVHYHTRAAPPAPTGTLEFIARAPDDSARVQRRGCAETGVETAV